MSTAAPTQQTAGVLSSPRPQRDKEKLLDDIERRLTADIRREPLFTLRWRLA